ncbi:hypothetical protein M8C13_31280 [Crossiella sp. SN42]|uniref:hypothetical protein n=1 Tax=Crossiella sp. SN42 TaxID=2944808 RepID=UPI00207D2421|nr:hypothetical protein [Crossiella sp. SN42]MCO1580248.1 hypothetical protein [Crossiella sp. SN42]
MGNKTEASGPVSPARSTRRPEHELIATALRPHLRPADPAPDVVAVAVARELPELAAVLRAQDRLTIVRKALADLRVAADSCRTDPRLDLVEVGTSVADCLIRLGRRLNPGGRPSGIESGDGFRSVRRMFSEHLERCAGELPQQGNPRRGNWQRAPIEECPPRSPSTQLARLSALTAALPAADLDRLWAERLTPVLDRFRFTRYPSAEARQHLIRFLLAGLPELKKLGQLQVSLAEAEQELDLLRARTAAQRQQFGMGEAEVVWRNTLARELRSAANAVMVGGALGVGFGAAFDVAANGIAQSLRELADRTEVPKW